jgi:hypothetical protein
MTRTHNPEDICAMCDEFKLKDADPAYRDIGMGICQKRVDTPMYSLVYVAWSNPTCVSYRLDKPNLSVRRQYVAMQRQAAEDVKNKSFE